MLYGDYDRDSAEDDEEETQGRHVGTILANYIDLASWRSAAQLSFDIFDVFDAHSEELADVFPYVVDKHGLIKKRLSGNPELDILYLKETRVREEYRRRGIASRALPYFIRVVGKGAGIAVLKPWPLEIGRDKSGVLPSEMPRLRSGKRSLRRLYKRVGFRPLGRSPFMYHDSRWPLTLPDGGVV